MDFDSTSAASNAPSFERPSLDHGPTTLKDLFMWGPQYLNKLSDHPVGKFFVDNLVHTLRGGVQVNTDYSGFGGPEIALHTLQLALSTGTGGITTNDILFWRGSDLLESRRKMLLAGSDKSSPRHVFGDILMRASFRTRKALRRIHEEAETKFEEKLAAGLSNQEHMAEEVGQWMMGQLVMLMRPTVFNLAARAYCFRCKGRCRVHGPERQTNGRPALTRMAIAGTTCTSWSQMGACSRWMAQSALPFFVWAFETLAWGPDLIVHECTPRFDVATLELIFGMLYLIVSFVISPTSLGWPAMRPRRFTILVHRERRVAPREMSAAIFSSLFFRKCMLDGHVFWCASYTAVVKYLCEKAEALHLPHTQEGSGLLWPARTLLKQGFHQRLLGYEKMCLRMGRAKKFIVNLHQSPSFTKSVTKMMPTLMTNTSLMWSMVHERCLLPLEHLVAMGIPILDEHRNQEDISGIELLIKQDKVTGREVVHAAGNGMSQICIGAVLLFALGGLGPLNNALVQDSFGSSDDEAEAGMASDPEI